MITHHRPYLRLSRFGTMMLAAHPFQPLSRPCRAPPLHQLAPPRRKRCLPAPWLQFHPRQSHPLPRQMNHPHLCLPFPRPHPLLHQPLLLLLPRIHQSSAVEIE
ncbi:unnamed protein product [Linum trigynum]|uniref:Uncharacterized protein n=1 Tax=Linum trigynum TaxID=586398 RepID=A0AAV2CV64_9ROSI